MAAVTVGNILLAVDNWVHRRERRELALAAELSGKPSLQVQLDDYKRHTEQFRLERAAVVAKELAAMLAEIRALRTEIDRLHSKASDEGDRMVKILGDGSIRFTRIETQVGELYRILDRRQEPRD